MTEDTRCPVCQAEFGNPGALGTHLSLTKDASHVAHRAQAEGAPLALPAHAGASPASPGQAERPASPEATNGIGAFGEAGKAGEASPGEAKAGGLPAFFESLASPPAQAPEAPQVLLLPAPSNVEPLIPPDAPAQAGESRPPAPPVAVPLEPILSGALAIGLNGLVLNKPGDGELTPLMVQGTGFPKAVEACLRLYFPDLPLDHPIVALIASGTGLGMLVLQLKAKHPPEDERPTPALAQATTRQAGEAPQAGEEPASSSTGDPYWDAILRSQGGGVQT